MEFDIWKILASKWTMFVLALAMMIALPSLWNNVHVVWTMQNVPSNTFWIQNVVFGMAILTMLGALFKFLNGFTADKNLQQVTADVTN